MCIGMVEMFFGASLPRWMNDDITPMTLWVVLSAVTNVVFAVNAKRKLTDEFRTVATSRFDAGKSGFWSRFGELFAKPRP